MKFKVITPGKLIITGEYAVLEDSPAIVMAVDRYSLISFESSRNPFFTIHSPTLKLNKRYFTIGKNRKLNFSDELTEETREKLHFFIKTFELFLSELSETSRIPPFNISIDTDQFYAKEFDEKLGLGSSAAISVGLIQGLLNIVFPDQPQIQKPLELYQLTQKIHFLSQGKKGSGIDVAASCFGGIISFHKMDAQYIQYLTIPDDLIIMPVWSGKSMSTRRLIDQVNRFKKSNPQKYRSIIARMHRISEQSIKHLNERHLSEFLHFCNEYNETMKELGSASRADIISQAHQELAEIARASGAYYKPSGAGGGDIGLFFTDSKTVARRVSDNILRSNYQMLNFKIANNGSRIVLK